MLRSPPKQPKIDKRVKLTPEQREEIKQLRMEGMKLEAIAAEYGVSHMAIYKYVKNIDIQCKNSAILALQQGETDGA